MAGQKVTYEFTKAGKMSLSVVHPDIVSVKGNGTWSLKGDKLTMAMKVDGKELTGVLTIKTLTDSKWVSIEDRAGKKITAEFKK